MNQQTELISLQVPVKFAEKFRGATDEFKGLFCDWMVSVMEGDREKRLQNLSSMMDYVGNKAQAKGLTEEKLAEILNGPT